MSDKPTIVQKASYMYANNQKSTVIRAAVQLLPGVGGALDMLMSGEAAKYQQERFDKQLESLNQRLNRIENITEHPLTDELYDLFIRIFETTVKTRSNQKRQYFSEMLAGVITKEKTWDEAEQYIRLISDLDDIHINILNLASSATSTGRAIGNTESWISISTTKARGAGMKSPIVLQSKLNDCSVESLTLACSELASRGLLNDVGVIASSTTYGSYDPFNYYAITKLGRAFVASILGIE